jgi:hypothetical protein
LEDQDLGEGEGDDMRGVVEGSLEREEEEDLSGGLLVPTPNQQPNFSPPPQHPPAGDAAQAIGAGVQIHGAAQAIVAVDTPAGKKRRRAFEREEGEFFLSQPLSVLISRELNTKSAF